MDVGNNEFWASKAYELSGVKARTYYSKSFGALGCSLAKSIGIFIKTKAYCMCNWRSGISVKYSGIAVYFAREDTSFNIHNK